MPGVPNADLAEIATAKLERYLLNPDHPEGGPKAKFFIGYGFSPERPDELRAALLAHVLLEHAAIEIRPGAVHYAVTGPMPMPDGRSPRVRSVWRIVEGDAAPRLVTAFSRRRR
jgi:hypothetical protein